MLRRLFQRLNLRPKSGEKIGCLYLHRDSAFTYTLIDSEGECVGVINAIEYQDLDYIRIDTFCVALKYRNQPNVHYGRQLLQQIIDEAKINPAIRRITVFPKGEERFDDIETMDTTELYKIYGKLGFRFSEPEIKPYGNMMVMELY